MQSENGIDDLDNLLRQMCGAGDQDTQVLALLKLAAKHKFLPPALRTDEFIKPTSSRYVRSYPSHIQPDVLCRNQTPT